MKIFITGVAGFIGSNLAKKLLSLGHEICGIDNMNYGFERNIEVLRANPKFQFIYGDIGNPMVIKDYKADIIVHLASQKIPRYSNALRVIDENYLMLKNVVNKCIIDRSKIVFASTSDVYGKNTNVPFSEDSDLLLGPPQIKRWAYALSKIYGEQFIMANNDEYGLPFTIVRFFGSYGPNQNLTWWGGPQSVFINQAFKKEPIEIHGDGKQTRTFTYIDDTIEALAMCVLSEKANGEIFNIATNPDEEIAIVDLAKIIWQLINGEKDIPKLNFIPYSTFGRYEDVPRRVPNIDKIKNILHFEPKIKLKEGLLKTIEWQKKIMKV
ncbi:MAG: NAD-dependent epimerase/dehydratase family protein [Bacteroidales bacterium]